MIEARDFVDACLEGEILHPGRAENNLVKVSCEGARGLLLRSYRNLLQTPWPRVAIREQAADNGNSRGQGALT